MNLGTATKKVVATLIFEYKIDEHVKSHEFNYR